MHELCRVGLVATAAPAGGDGAPLAPAAALQAMMPSPAPSFEQLAALGHAEGGDGGAAPPGGTRHAMMIYAIAEACEGVSGRALRKLPFLAHALFGAGRGSDGGGGAGLPLETYLDALRRAVAHEHAARDAMA